MNDARVYTYMRLLLFETRENAARKRRAKTPRENALKRYR
jgi:hypothetical protein